MVTVLRNTSSSEDELPAIGAVSPIFPESLRFPEGFLWGISTAAHQVEGGSPNNQWTAWESAGRIKAGNRCGKACDWWENAEVDFDLARDLGVNSLRLSVEWGRIEPEEGRWNDQALDRYRLMLQGLHDRGIQPMVCLHHFSHPVWFEREGAFLGRNSAQLFERFTRHVVRGLGDLCRHWVTLNEPNVYAALGYVLGDFPPGAKGKIPTALRVIGAMGRAHTLAYHAIHELQSDAQVGWAHNYVVFQPANPGFPPDRWIAGLMSYLFNESFLQVIERGRLTFPLGLFGGKADGAKGACDFIGLNVYSRFHVAFDLKCAAQLFGRVFVPGHVPQGDHGFENPYGEAYPRAIRVAAERVARMAKPVYILENGVPDAQDRIRPWLIVSAARELHNLIRDGHDVRGYFHWTLTDNFEWSEGWGLRFGLIGLDPETQQRTMRNSAYLYGSIARNNELSPETIERYCS